MTTSNFGARILLAAGLAFTGLAALVAAEAGAQQEQAPQGEVLLRPGPMLLGGAAGLGGGQESTEQDETAETMPGGMADHDGMAEHGGGAAPEQAAAGPAGAAYQAAMDRMHQDMAIAATGDPDVDFARAMIPHHQGAVEMAKAVLAHGKDPEIRRIAETVIGTQEREIAQLNDWLLHQGR